MIGHTPEVFFSYPDSPCTLEGVVTGELVCGIDMPTDEEYVRGVVVVASELVRGLRPYQRDFAPTSVLWRYPGYIPDEDLALIVGAIMARCGGLR